MIYTTMGKAPMSALRFEPFDKSALSATHNGELRAARQELLKQYMY
jgi:hypothetical protein